MTITQKRPWLAPEALLQKKIQGPQVTFRLFLTNPFGFTSSF